MIKAMVDSRPEWHSLPAEDHANRVHSALRMKMAPNPAPSLMEVQAFLRRARHPHQG